MKKKEDMFCRVAVILTTLLSVAVCGLYNIDDNATYLSKNRYLITPWKSMPDNTVCTRDSNRITARCQMPIENGRECLRQCADEHTHCTQAMLRHIDGEKVCYMKLNIRQDCNDASVLNIWQYSYWASYGTDLGHIRSWTYVKQHAFTDVHVRWIGNLRGPYHQANAANRWFFTFKSVNVECTSGAIDFTVYQEELVDYHIHSEFGGFCKDLPAGNVFIGFSVGKSLASGIPRGDAYASRWTRHRFIISEVDTRPNIEDECPLHSVINIKEYIQSNLYDDRDTGNVMTYVYKKRAPDTSLRVRLIMNMRGQGTNVCARYSITLDGQDCKYPGPIEGEQYWIRGKVKQELRGHSIEGICHDFKTRNVTVAVAVLKCHSNIEMMDAFSGWYSTSRLQVEEVRLGMPFREYIVSDDLENGLHNFTTRTNQFNIQYWTWKNLNDSDNNHKILNVTYNKQMSDSGLKVTLSSNFKIEANTGTSCTRWWFMFNNVKCTTPGDIESTNYRYSWGVVVQQDLPNTVTGICGGISAGTVDIALWVGACHSGEVIAESRTGYDINTNLIAEEVYYS